MKFTTTAIAAAAAAGLVSAAPAAKRDYSVTDTQILQYALTLEHLEDFFYHDALNKMDAGAFRAAGYPDWVRNRVSQIASHEADHVALLTGALGNSAVAACTYKFPYTDPKSFLALATVIENVGVSAYLGAASYIMDKAYVTVAGAILTTEARHQAWLSSAVDKTQPWSGAYDTPLDFSNVYSIATAFITGCPASNGALPFKAFPALTIGDANPNGKTVQLTYDDSTTDQKFLVIYDGLVSKAYPINGDKTVTFPSGLQGISYAVVASVSDASKVDDSNTVAGPAIIDVPFSSTTPNPTFMG